MTLVTTAGAANADSYATITEADAYFTNRGIVAWTGVDAIKENVLRRATTYLDNQYRGRWVGLTVAQTQALAWPRIDGSRGNQAGRGFGYGWTFPLWDIDGFQIATDTIPQQIKTATMEAALLALTGTSLEPTLARGGQIKQEVVGPISVTYMDGAPVVDRYIVIEGLLRGLVTGTPGSSSGNVRLVRS